MKKIQLTQGQVVLVDDKNFERLNHWKWYAQKDKNTFYAARMSPWINGKRYPIHMHHEIIGRPPKGFETDHENGNGLDNQRHNLRHVTLRQNSQNKRNIKKSSQYPGVCWFKRDKCWRAYITINGIQKHLGYFINETDAFIAYKQAIEVIGERIIGEAV